MKAHSVQLPVFIAGLGLAAWGTGVAQAQLANGLLDLTSVSSQILATPTGWTVTASRTISGAFNDGASSEGFANYSAPGGQGLFFKPFTGNATDGNVTVRLYQDLPATAGLTYTLTGYAGAEANYSGLMAVSPTKSQFALEFLDAGSAVIGGAVLDLKAAGLGTPNANPFGYAQYMVAEVAPVGTVMVRVSASMIDGFNNPAGGGQAFVVDAFAVTAVPEPATVALFGLGLVGLWAVRRRS